MDAPKPLAGIKILELSTVVTAALAATILSEQGAQTVKVEPMGIGDTLRYLGSNRAGVSAMFANCNRGKRSLALDLKTSEGLEIVRKLALDADVLISNYRPGVLERLGLGSDALRKANPGLVYVAISGFGTEGPQAAAPAYDHVIQAMSGFTDMQGQDGELDMIKTFICDEVTAYTACQATTAALLQRTRTGQGEHIDVSMLDSSLYFLWPSAMSDHTLLGDGIKRGGLLKHSYRTYPTRDGYVAMAPLTDAHWQGLFKGTGREDLADDPRYASIASRSANYFELLEVFHDAFSELATTEVESLLADLDIPGTACLTLDEVIEHPQVTAVGAVQTQEHPVLGQLRSPAHPARFDGRRYPPATPLGALGEHTRGVLGELGYENGEIDSLITAGVVSEPTTP